MADGAFHLLVSVFWAPADKPAMHHCEQSEAIQKFNGGAMAAMLDCFGV